MSLTSDERDHLRSTARDLLEQASSPDRVRQVVAGGAGHDRALWDRIVDLGWTGIHVPEELGGAGCTYADLAVVLEELGRAIAPTPFLASTVLATGALLRADNTSLAQGLLRSLAAGERLGSVALAGTSGSYESPRMTATWESRDGDIRIRGSAACVLDPDLADVLIVAAVDAAGAPVVAVVDAGTSGLSWEHRPTTDSTRRLFTVSFDDLVVGHDQLLCEPGHVAAELRDGVIALGTVAAMADATGVAGKVLDTSVAYAGARTQFGRPIGSFQAVKHHCANMAIAVEASRASIRGAVRALDGASASWASAASTAASFVGPACSETAALGLRVHGGVGFTWEHDSHLYLKRAKLDEVLFGTPSWHRRRLANAVFPALAPST